MARAVNPHAALTMAIARIKDIVLFKYCHIINYLHFIFANLTIFKNDKFKFHIILVFPTQVSKSHVSLHTFF